MPRVRCRNPTVWILIHLYGTSLVACQLAIEPGEGEQACAPDGRCPEGYGCYPLNGEKRCFRHGSNMSPGVVRQSGGGTDTSNASGGSDGSVARVPGTGSANQRGGGMHSGGASGGPGGPAAGDSGMGGDDEAPPASDVFYLKPSNPAGGARFGRSVALSMGHTLVVGASWAERGGFAQAGAAYVFQWNGDEWSEVQELVASNPGVRDSFGDAVAISSDTAVVGAPGEDSSARGVDGDQADDRYVFTRGNGGAWTQTAYLKANDPDKNDFLDVAAISGDVVAVGSTGDDGAGTGLTGDPTDNSLPGSGAVYLFHGF